MPSALNQRVAPDERRLADVNPTRRTVFFPFLELILATGLIWLAIGMIDRFLATVGYDSPSIVMATAPESAYAWLVWGRRGLLLLWVLWGWRRCIRFFLYRRRTRAILTTHRLLTLSGEWRRRVVDIPLEEIAEARLGRRGSVEIYIRGARDPYVLQSMPRARRFVELVRQARG